MKILFPVSECAPFIKSGGLADVASALPVALAKSQIDARVVMPLYKQIKDRYQEQLTFITSTTINMAWRNVFCGIWTLIDNGVQYYFIENEYYYNRNGLYEYYHDVKNDEAERYSYFSLAVLEILPLINFIPDIIHSHDWHTAMVGYLLKNKYHHEPGYNKIKSVFTIHNLQYQGVFDVSTLEDLLGLSYNHFNPEALEFHGQINFMKAGILAADVVTTVSETYKFEIQSAFYGCDLDGLLRSVSYKLEGIINGLDVSVYNALTDNAIKENFDYATLEKKRINKTDLQAILGLNIDEGVPIIAMVTRLSNQKGIDLVKHVFHDLMQNHCQFILLGTGNREDEQFFRQMEHEYPKKVCSYIGFSEDVAKRIYAAADMFLMPSIFEPCGLSQLIAMAYATIPIVRKTGGLHDTVHHFNKETLEGTGFVFENINAHDMLYTINEAITIYFESPDKWNTLMQNAIKQDFSWDASSKKYKNIYEKIMK